MTTKKVDEQEQKTSELILSEVANEITLPLAVKDDSIQG